MRVVTFIPPPHLFQASQTSRLKRSMVRDVFKSSVVPQPAFSKAQDQIGEAEGQSHGIQEVRACLCCPDIPS